MWTIPGSQGISDNQKRENGARRRQKRVACAVCHWVMGLKLIGRKRPNLTSLASFFKVFLPIFGVAFVYTLKRRVPDPQIFPLIAEACSIDSPSWRLLGWLYKTQTWDSTATQWRLLDGSIFHVLVVLMGAAQGGGAWENDLRADCWWTSKFPFPVLCHTGFLATGLVVTVTRPDIDDATGPIVTYTISPAHCAPAVQPLHVLLKAGQSTVGGLGGASAAVLQHCSPRPVDGLAHGKPTSAAELLLRTAVPQSRPSDTKPRLLPFVHRIFVWRPSGCPHSWTPTWFHCLTTSLWSPAGNRMFSNWGTHSLTLSGIALRPDRPMAFTVMPTSKTVQLPGLGHIPVPKCVAVVGCGWTSDHIQQTHPRG
ncbi:hypothetical protein B0H14DRAFT_2583796 [Mycena olivaceomarginata]|nr:hypothetical protein B0H14DRAFT_2583796 [Mycena olivaceomarginata]